MSTGRVSRRRCRHCEEPPEAHLYVRKRPPPKRGSARTVPPLDGGAPAGGLRWSCWETLEHLIDDLFTYAIQVAASNPPRDDLVPFDYHSARDGGPANSLFLQANAGTAGLLQALEVC